MHTQSLDPWRHDHTFGQDRTRAGERRTLIVIAITATMMVVEIAAGIAFGSMALLADGLHMGSHTAALGLAAFAYIYARRHAADPRYSFGTGKVNALAGFTGAIALAGFALVMLIESIGRFFHPVTIHFWYAISVAIAGLIVNGVSMLILGGHGQSHHHGHSHGHGHAPARRHAHEHEHDGEPDHDHRDHEDHNLRSAYLHVLADALTSVLAIFALLTARYLGTVWMDPLMGVVGAGLVARWSLGLTKQSGRVLLDRQASQGTREAIVAAVQRSGDSRVSDLHVWSIGPAVYAAEIAVVSSAPLTPDAYKALLPDDVGLAHVTVEVHTCPDPTADRRQTAGGSRGSG